MNMGSIGVLLAQKLFSSIDDPEGKMDLIRGVPSGGITPESSEILFFLVDI
jgi:hypothetical protein